MMLKNWWPDIVIVDKEKRECIIIIDFAAPGDQSITIKEREKITKCQDLRIEIEKPCNVKQL